MAVSVLNMQNGIYRRRRVVNRIMLTVSLSTLLFGLFWLFWIILTLLMKGAPALSYTLFTEITPPPGQTGGLLNAVIGSVLMAGVGTLIGTPVGILAGTYLAEYGQRGWLAPATRFLNDVLLSAPSIIIGLFIYAVYVAQVGHYSGWAGAIALSILVIPVVVRTTDNMLLLVPNSLREAAAALGCPVAHDHDGVLSRRQDRHHHRRAAGHRPHLGRDRAAAVHRPVQPVHVAEHERPHGQPARRDLPHAASPFKDWNNLAWAGATLITLLVLGINILARNMFRK